MGRRLLLLPDAGPSAEHTTSGYVLAAHLVQRREPFSKEKASTVIHCESSGREVPARLCCFSSLHFAACAMRQRSPSLFGFCIWSTTTRWRRWLSSASRCCGAT